MYYSSVLSRRHFSGELNIISVLNCPASLGLSIALSPNSEVPQTISVLCVDVLKLHSLQRTVHQLGFALIDFSEHKQRQKHVQEQRIRVPPRDQESQDDSRPRRLSRIGHFDVARAFDGFLHRCLALQRAGITIRCPGSFLRASTRRFLSRVDIQPANSSNCIRVLKRSLARAVLALVRRETAGVA